MGSTGATGIGRVSRANYPAQNQQNTCRIVLLPAGVFLSPRTGHIGKRALPFHLTATPCQVCCRLPACQKEHRAPCSRHFCKGHGVLCNHENTHAAGAYSPFVFSAREAFKIANTETPTSANTAAHILASPRAESTSTPSLIASANTMFCRTIFSVFCAM